MTQMANPDSLPPPEKTPRFRDWLLVCARNFLIDAVRKEKALRRQPRKQLLSLDVLREATGQAFEPAANDSPEQAFRHACRRDILDRALQQVDQLATGLAREADFKIFLEYYLTDGPEPVSWEALAARFGLPDWKRAVNKADWIKRQLVRAIREEMRRSLDSDDDVDDELRELLG